jgi:uncharacterized membrane protein YhiD involved in acid resistance
MMIGFGMIKEALFMSILIFFVLGVMSIIERYVRLTFFPDPATDEVAAPKKVRASRKKITEDND